MCLDPVTLGGLALSGVGSYLQAKDQVKNQDRATDAKRDAMEAEQIKQRRIADETGAAFGENVQKQGREGFDEQSQEAETKTKRAFGAIRAQPDYNTGLPGNTAKNVVIARQQKSDEAGDKTNRDLSNLAALSSYDNAMFNQGLDNNKFMRLFGNINDRAGRSAALLPGDIRAAETNSQKAPSMIGPALSLAGKGISFAGSTGMFDNGFAVPFTGSQSYVNSGGIPIPGKKPTILFGSQIGSV